METVYIKIISTGIIFTVTFLGGFLPFSLLRKFLKGNSSAEDKLCLLRCLAGGIFLGTCLVHLLPEAREAMTTAFGEQTDYPVTEACVGIGFLLMYMTENLMLACQPKPLKMETSVAFSYTSKTTDQDEQKVQIRRYGSLDESDSGGEGLLTASRKGSKEDTEDVFVSDTEPLVDSGEAEVVLNIDKTLKKSVSISDEESRSTNFTSFRSYVLLIALSLHTVFDGLVIGIQTSASLVWTLLVAMSIHKSLVAFSLGLSFLDSHANRPRSAVLYLLFFSVVAPVGAGIGTALTESNFNTQNRAYAAGFLQSLATGTFMFVTFCECLKDELLGTRHFLKLILVIIGFSIVAGLRFAIKDN